MLRLNAVNETAIPCIDDVVIVGDKRFSLDGSPDGLFYSDAIRVQISAASFIILHVCGIYQLRDVQMSKMPPYR